MNPANVRAMSSPPPLAFSPRETAKYTHDTLESLRKIAVYQGQELLAHLLQLAALEAKCLSDQADHETSLPA